jgi:hypothetical protein
MTLAEANAIWEACYGDSTDPANGWDRYSSAQRMEAIDVRQLEHERLTGGWGTWNISDRH